MQIDIFFINLHFCVKCQWKTLPFIENLIVYFGAASTLSI
jgi:hypothetical protein